MWRNELKGKIHGSVLVIFLILVTLTSCSASRKFVHFEVLQPSTITYPESVNKIGYVNRAPLIKSISDHHNKSQNDSDLAVVDTIIGNNLKRGFLEGSESNDITYLDSIVFFESRRKRTANQSDEMPFRTRQSLMYRNNLDALISLEYFKVSLNVVYENYFFSAGEMVYTENSIKEYEFVMDLMYRIYVKNQKEVFDNYMIHDSLYFLPYPPDDPSKAISPTEMIRMGAYDFGYMYGLRQVPVWEEVTRHIFRRGYSELNMAAKYADKGEWDLALEKWKTLINNPNPKLAAKANHNIALYYELNDEIEKALEAASKALELWDNPHILLYKQELEIRLMNKSDLLRQIR